MAATGDWDDDIARAITPRPHVVRQAVREGIHFTNAYRQQRWPTQTPAAPTAVYLARNGLYYALALDLDVSGTAATRQAAALAALLSTAGIRYTQATSGPTGRQHLICTWTTGLPADQVAQLARRLKEHAPDLDLSPLLNPKTGCIRPPGSAHRDGGASTLITPRTEALATLQGGNDIAAFERLQDHLGIRNQAPHAAAERAANPDDARRPRQDQAPKLHRVRRDLSATEIARLHAEVGSFTNDRSAEAAWATLVIVNAGWTFTEYLALVNDPNVKAFDHLRRRKHATGYTPRTDIEDRARRMWLAKIRYALDNPAHGATPIVEAVEQCATAAAATTWAGQGGPSARGVLEALIELARRIGTDTVSSSVRTLALNIGVSRTAAANAVKRLERAGWIQQTAAPAPTLAPSYRLTIPDTLKRAAPSNTDWTLAPPPLGPDAHKTGPTTTFTLGLTHRAHDTMTSEGLGRYAGLLMDHLHNQPLTIAQIAERTTWDHRTIRRYLGLLAAHGLVIPTNPPDNTTGAIWEAIPERVDTVARSLRVTGTIERRREQTTHERLTWAWWCADHEAEHGWATQRGLRTPGYRTTKTGTPSPAMPYPLTTNGRRNWRAAASLIANGHGPTTQDHDNYLHHTRTRT